MKLSDLDRLEAIGQSVGGREVRELEAKVALFDPEHRPWAAQLVAWDTETWRIAPGRLAPPLVCASMSWRLTGGICHTALLDRSEVIETLTTLLADDGPQLVAHNGAFDAAVAWAADSDLGPPVWRALDAGRLRCTRVREKLLQVARGEANRASPSSEAVCHARRGLLSTRVRSTTS
jgi:hypothetical protein